MSERFKEVFGTAKPVIAMVHLGALPGAPLYDAQGGLDALVEAVVHDLDALQEAGFDAVMFGNENDRPYEFEVDTASTAAMAYVIGRVRDRDHGAVRRQRAVGPDVDRWRWRQRPALPSSARSSPAPMRPTWVRGRRMPARPCAIATGSAAPILRCSTTSRPSSPIRSTSAASPDRARSAVFSSIPDAILVSGQITGEAAALSDLEAVKKALPDTPVWPIPASSTRPSPTCSGSPMAASSARR